MINATSALSLLGGGTSSSSSTMTALAAFTNYNKDQVAARTAFANSDAVTDAIADFKASAKKIASVDDLLADRGTLTFVLSAFGLESDIDSVGKIKAVLNSDPDDVNSFANRLTDTRYADLAAFLDTPEFGTTRLQQSDKQSELIDRYLTNEFEKSIGSQNESARDALFFLRRINEVETAYEILADSALRAIVTDALNLPDEIANQSVEKQAALIEAGIDLDAFQTSGAASDSVSELDTLTSDLESISSASSALAAGQSAVGSIVDQLTALRDLYAGYSEIVDPAGVFADEMPVQEAAIPDLLAQRGLVAAASVAIEDTASALDEIQALYTQAQNAEDADELAGVKTDFEAAVARIIGTDGAIAGATYTDPNTGTTRNLLLNGSSGTLPDGVDATDATIRTTVDTEGTQAVTKSTDLSDFLSDLQSFSDALMTADFDTLSDDLEGADDLLDAATSAFDAAEFMNQINRYSLDNALGSVTFAVELDTASIAEGLTTVDDALARADKVELILADIRALAKQAQEEDADLDAINASYAFEVDHLRTVIETGGTAAGGGIALDNLLNGASGTYNVLDGTLVQAEGSDLIASIVDQLPGTITPDNAADLKEAVDGAYSDALEAAVDGLTRDRRVIAFAAETLDPLGTFDARISNLSDQLGTIVDGAEVDGVNLLSPYSSDLKVTLDSLASVLTVDAQSDFTDTLGDAFEAFRSLVLTGGSIEDRIAAVNDALFAAGRIQSNLQAEAYALNIQEEIVSARKTEIEGSGGSAGSFLEEQEYSSAALKFIQRYLVQKDLEASGYSASGTDARTSMISQLGAILPSSSSGISLSLLV